MLSGKNVCSGLAAIFTSLIPVVFISSCASDMNPMIEAMVQTLNRPEGSVMTQLSQHGHPCAEQNSIRGKVTAGPANGPMPWGRTLIYEGVVPMLIDIGHCGNVSGSGNIPFMLVVYGKRETSFGEPPVLLKVVLQMNNNIAPFVSRQQASGYRIEAWGIMSNLTGDYAYFLDTVPVRVE